MIPVSWNSHTPNQIHLNKHQSARWTDEMINRSEKGIFHLECLPNTNDDMYGTKKEAN